MSENAFIVLVVPPSIASSVAQPGGVSEDDLHVTLAFLGQADALTLGQIRMLTELTEQLAASYTPFEARFSGAGRFMNTDQEVFYGAVESTTIAMLRADLLSALEANDFTYADNYTFVPHITIGYLRKGDPMPETVLPEAPFTFTELALCIGEERMVYSFTGDAAPLLSIGKRLLLGRPFGDYADMDDCITQNQDKADPGAYCAALEHDITGKWPGEKRAAIASHKSVAADEADAWTKPTLSDFTDVMWDKLDADEREAIASNFAWTASMPPETYGDLKLPHHDPSTGNAVWLGVVAAMAALMGARGGVDIPDVDRQGVYSHLKGHYALWDKPVPDFKERILLPVMPINERYHDVFTEALREYLKDHVSFDDFEQAIRYARAKAGGSASGAARRKKREELHSDVIAKLLLGEPLTTFSSAELLMLADQLPIVV